MQKSNDTENKIPTVKEVFASYKLVQKIFGYVMLIYFCGMFSAIAAGGVTYCILQLPFKLNILAFIAGAAVFIFAFKIIFNKFINAKAIPSDARISDYEGGNTNDPRNPSSYGTPGSPYYAYDIFERDRFHEHKSAFSDRDYYNR